MVVVPTCMQPHNKRALLTRLQRLAAGPRADLANSPGLSQSTTGKIVDDRSEADDVAVREACTARVRA